LVIVDWPCRESVRYSIAGEDHRGGTFFAAGYLWVQVSVATVHMLACARFLVADSLDAADRDGAAAVSGDGSAVGGVAADLPLFDALL
jgi:hypothetical protein